MRVNPSGFPQRAGLTLLEVIVAMAIFLFSSVAIYQLIAQGGDNAVHVQMQARACMLCQSKLAEIIVGAEENGSGQFQEDPDWQWQVDKNPADIEGLWSVRVTVRRDRPDGRTFEASLSQLVLEPSLRGSTLLRVPGNGSSSSGGSSSSSDPSSSTSGGK